MSKRKVGWNEVRKNLTLEKKGYDPQIAVI